MKIALWQEYFFPGQMDYCSIDKKNQYMGTKSQDVWCERKAPVLGIGRFRTF